MSARFSAKPMAVDSPGIRVVARSPGLAVSALACVLLIGCGSPESSSQDGGRSIADRFAQDSNAKEDDSQSDRMSKRGGSLADDRALATVNGRPIERSELVGLLIRGRGLPLLQQIILRDLARQEAERLGRRLSSAEIDHEYDLTLQGARFDGKDVKALTPVRREQLIDEWTRNRGVPREELRVAMTRQAHLRLIVREDIEITTEMLEVEYRRVHGEKVEVRHIQLAAERVYSQIRERLARGDRFEDLVMDYSQNRLSREKAGLLPPFSADDRDTPPIFVKAAFALAPGQVSNPIEAEGSHHVLKLERRISADEVPFDEVREELRRNLHARLVAERMEALGSQLLMRAKIRIDDRALREQYRRHLRQGSIEGPVLID